MIRTSSTTSNKQTLFRAYKSGSRWYYRQSLWRAESSVHNRFFVMSFEGVFYFRSLNFACGRKWCVQVVGRTIVVSLFTTRFVLSQGREMSLPLGQTDALQVKGTEAKVTEAISGKTDFVVAEAAENLDLASCKGVKGARRFMRYLNTYPHSHIDCWAGNVPTALHETAAVRMTCLPYQPTHESIAPTHIAFMCGSVAAAQLVLDTVRDAGSITSTNGLTLLHAAALGGQPPDVLQQLLQRGCSPSSKDTSGRSVMHYAALGGCVDTMKFVLARSGSMTGVDTDTMLAAAEGGSIEAMKFVLANGGRITDKDSYGWTVMMAAAFGGSVEAMKFVLANGGSITETDRVGTTVMMAAAEGGSVEAMKFVLANGGSMTDKDIGGLTVMMAAARGGSVKAMKFVLANGGSMTETDWGGGSVAGTDRAAVMMAAAEGGSVEAMKFVLANGGSITDKMNDGWTAMMAAAFGGFVDAMKYVLANGGSITDKDISGITVMMEAANGSSVEAIEFLLANGGSVTEKDCSGSTAMSFAARRGSVEVMKCVLANGGSMDGVLDWCCSVETANFCMLCGGM